MNSLSMKLRLGAHQAVMIAVPRGGLLRTIGISALGIACSAVPVSAQTAPPPSTLRVDLSLAAALAQALANNPDLAVSRRDIDISRGRLQQARHYPFNPELNVQGDAGQGTGRGDTTERRGIGGGSIGLSQVVEIRGQQGLRIQAAEFDTARTEWTVRDAERDVLAATSRAFSERAVTLERVSLSRATADLLAALKRTVDQRFEAGDVSQIDALRADVEVRRAANRLVVDEASAAAANRTLALLIGASAAIDLRPSGSIVFDPIPDSLDELRARAKASRPDLKAATAAREQANRAWQLVDSERFLPSITFSAAYEQANEFDSLNRRVLFGVSIPLPFWNRRSGDVRAAEAEIRKRESDRDRLLAQIDKDVVAAYDAYIAARRVIEEYMKSIVPGQERSVALILEGYRAGEFRLTEALLAQRDLVDVRTTYFDAVATHNAAVIDVQKAVGMHP